MARIDLSSIGVQTAWAAETTAGTMPTSAARLHGLKAVPALSVAPENIQTTTFDELEFHTYIPGLKDLGGALELTANLTQQLKDEWEAVMESYNTNIATGKSLWFYLVIPGLDEAYAFTFQPTPLGPGEISVSSVLETPLSITPTNEPAWVTKPTITDSDQTEVA